MNATAMMISAMPSGGIGSLSRPVPEPPEASKPLFCNKGLLLSDRSPFGRHFHAISAIMTRENCCHDGMSFKPRDPVFEDFRIFFAKKSNFAVRNCFLSVVSGKSGEDCRRFSIRR